MRLLVPVLLLATLGCRPDDPVAPITTDPHIAVTFYPLAEFVEALVGDAVEVRSPLPAGADPSQWQPDREALEVFRSAALVVSNGAAYERWLDHASLAGSRHLRSANAFRDEWIEVETRTHSHGAGEHTHQGYDGHTWLDPILARRQVEAIAERLLAVDREDWPDLSARVRARRTELDDGLQELDERLRALTPRLANVDLFASHAAYDYLARRYGWSIRSIEPSDLPEASERPQLMLWEREPWPDAPRRALHLTFSTAESPHTDEAEIGYFGIQERNLERLEAALDALGV